MPVQTAVFRRECFAATAFDTSLRSSEDWELFIRMAYTGAKFGYVHSVHCDCLIHDGNLVSNGGAERRAASQMVRMWKNVSATLPMYKCERRLCAHQLGKALFDLGYQCAKAAEMSLAVRCYCHSFVLRPRLAVLRGILGAILRAKL
jgi:hypothetical protein